MPLDRPTTRDVKAAGLGGSITSAIVFTVERLTHNATVPLELHQRLFEEMVEALRLCQGIGP